MTSRATVCLLLAAAGCRAESAPPVVAEAPPPVTAEPLPPIPAGAAQRPARPLSHLSGRATEVTSVDGDIVAKDAAGHQARLTATGMDGGHALSPDGLTVVFSRAKTKPDEWNSDLYLARVDRGDPELLVAGGSTLAEGRNAGLLMQGINSPSFAVGGGHVLFEIFNGAHMSGLCSIDLRTRKIEEIATPYGWAQIRQGPHRGHIFVGHQVTDYRPRQECEIVDVASGRIVRPYDCFSTKSLLGGDDYLGMKP